MTQITIPANLNASQAAIWMAQCVFPTKPICTVGQALTIPGKLDHTLFGTALDATLAEVPGFRLSNLGATHAIRAASVLTTLDLRRNPDPDEAAEAWMQAEIGNAITLDQATLCQFALLQVAEDRTIWFQKYHHIAVDWKAQRLFCARVAETYRALLHGTQPAAIAASTIAEILLAEQSYRASPAYDADSAYWQARFDHLPAPLMQADRSNTEARRSGQAQRRCFSLARADFNRFERHARQLGASSFGAFVTLTYIAFMRLYERDDLVLGLGYHQRRSAASRNMISSLVQNIPFRIGLTADCSLAEAIRQIERARSRDVRHARFSMQDINAALGTTRQGRNGLFDVMINYLSDPYDFCFDDPKVRYRCLSRGLAFPWQIAVEALDGEDLVQVWIDTDPGLIPPDEAERLAEALQTLLLDALNEPDRQLRRVPIMSAESRQKVLALAAAEEVDLPPGQTLVSLFEAQARQTPQAEALRFQSHIVQYGELLNAADDIAAQLATLPTTQGGIVSIALPRSEWLLPAVLGVLKSGAAYLPLDPEYPEQRIAFIVADAAVPVILTTAALAPRFAGSGARLMLLDQPDAHAPRATPTAPGPDDLAYVLYTSGSTGTPKAVGVRHSNVVNLICWARSILSDADLEGMLFSTSLNFDLSAFELFAPLCFGGRVVMVQNLLALQSSPDAAEVRLVNSGPSLLDALLRTGGLPTSVETVIVAGEKLPRLVADRLFAAVPGVRFLNLYGPTETTVYSTWAPVHPQDRHDPTIGRALWNTTLYVLDRHGELLPPGAQGELYIGGAGVARGYLGRPELTAERFLPDLCGHGQMYRTGDRVCWRSDGELQTLGRIDQQIKINGLRVEPGEIEAALLALPGIQDAVVALHTDDFGVRRLIAYVVACEGSTPDMDAIRAGAAQLLPMHMRPSSYVQLDRLPMTPNGKLDRGALRPPERARELAPNRAPEGELELKLAEIWSEVLAIPATSVHLDFFDHGGDSLALLNLFAAIEAEFGVDLSIDMLAGGGLSDGLTIADLVRALIYSGISPDRPISLIALQPRGDLPSFFCVHSIGGDAVQYRLLAKYMGEDRPLYAFHRRADDDLSASVPVLAARYIALMRQTQPAGPYHLGGYSFGAIVAYEMARQLVAAGDEVADLLVVDTRCPSWRPTIGNLLPMVSGWVSNVPPWLRDEAKNIGRSQLPLRVIGLLRAALRKMAGLPVDSVPGLDLSKLQPNTIDVIGAHLRIAQQYCENLPPRPANRLNIHVIRCAAQPLRFWDAGPYMGWELIAEDRTSATLIDGNHQSITRHPGVRVLAAAVVQALGSR